MKRYRFFGYSRSPTTLLWTVRTQSFHMQTFKAAQALELATAIATLKTHPDTLEIATILDGHIEIVHPKENQ